MDNVTQSITQQSNLGLILGWASEHPVSFMFIVAMLFLLVLGAVFLVYKLIIFFVKKAKFKVKLGDKEVALNEDKDNKHYSPSDNKNNDRERDIKLLKTLFSSIIDCSIESGYKKSEKRQVLFRVQMNDLEENLETIRTQVVADYIKNNGINVEIVRALLIYAFNKCVITQYRHIMEADNLVQKTKDGVVETNRHFIDTCISQIFIEFKNFSNYTNDKESSFSESLLLQCLESRQDLIRKLLVNSLEFAYDEEVKYFKEIDDLNKQLNDKVTSLLSFHLDGDSKPNDSSWVNESVAAPPKHIAGV